MVDVFDEVEEELRRERYQSALRKWGPWVLGGAVAIVVGVASWQYWDWRTTNASSASAEDYITAARLFEDGDLAGADAAFSEMAETGPVGYATLSLMRRGEIAISEGRSDDAARFFEQAAERAPEPFTRDLARYKAALARFDALSYDDLSVRLTPLTEGDALFGIMARELIAAAALRDERWDEARSAYQLIQVALDAPPGVARRAGEALVYIRQNAPEEAAVVDAIPADPAPTEATDAPVEGEAPDATEASTTDADAPASETEEDGR